MPLFRNIAVSFAALVGTLVGASASCPAATIVYHVHGVIPEAFRGEEDFMHFSLHGEASGTPAERVSINNFQTDGANYFGASVGTVSGTFPDNVVLTDDDATGNYSNYTQRIVFGTYVSFDVVLKGPQFEGTSPVNGYVEFVLDIYRSATNGYAPILVNDNNFGSIEIGRDSNIDSGALFTAAHAAFTVTLVPEPASLALIGLGGPSLLRRTRRNANAG